MQIIDANYVSESVLDNLFMVYHSKIDSETSQQQIMKEKQERVLSLEENLVKKLSTEDSKELQELLLSVNDINFHLNKAYFKEGVVQGAKLIQEISPTE